MIIEEIDIGMILVITGAGLFVAEVIIPGFFVGVVASAVLLLGFFSLIFEDLFSSPIIVMLILLAGLSVGMAISILFYKKLGKTSKPITTTGDTLIGRTGVLVKATDPNRPTAGKMRIGSEMWSVEAEKVIEEGTKVVVVKAIGSHVKVKVYEK